MRTDSQTLARWAARIERPGMSVDEYLVQHLGLAPAAALLGRIMHLHTPRQKLFWVDSGHVELPTAVLGLEGCDGEGCQRFRVEWGQANRVAPADPLCGLWSVDKRAAGLVCQATFWEGHAVACALWVRSSRGTGGEAVYVGVFGPANQARGWVSTMVEPIVWGYHPGPIQILVNEGFEDYPLFGKERRVK